MESISEGYTKILPAPEKIWSIGNFIPLLWHNNPPVQKTCPEEILKKGI
jgi:hypothetical protein